MITQKQLKEWLEYNPATGDFVWLKKPAKQIAIGTTAGCITDADAYIKIRILGDLYHAHRLASRSTEWIIPYKTLWLPSGVVSCL